MTEAQQEDLFVEWDLYELNRQFDMIDEYRCINKGDYCKNSFLDFLKDKLEIERYWKKVGLA